MRIIFLGTPQLAVSVLQRLLDAGHEIAAVMTQPDKPAGRNRQTTPTPVKILAIENGIDVIQPNDLKNAEFLETVQSLNADIGVVFAYGKIIPQQLLDIPKYGMINIHASLLPRWRGAAPIQRAVMAGDKETGITIMQMDAGLDTGDILLKRELRIKNDDTAGSLTEELSGLGATALLEALDKIERQDVTPEKQDDSKATYAEKISDKDYEIDWSKESDDIDNQVRGLSPKPGAFTYFNDKKIKIWRASRVTEDEVKTMFLEACQESGPSETGHTTFTGKPGDIITVDKRRGPVVATGTGLLVLDEMQPENKKKLSGGEFVCGYRIKTGDKLGR
jgi:methionyl-tRNA formyltransferase